MRHSPFSGNSQFFSCAVRKNFSFCLHFLSETSSLFFSFFFPEVESISFFYSGERKIFSMGGHTLKKKPFFFPFSGRDGSIPSHRKG